MGTILASAAGSAIGHVVGRTVMNGFEGRGDSNDQPMEQQQQQEDTMNYNNNDNVESHYGSGAYVENNNNYDNNLSQRGPCVWERSTFQQCLASNNNTLGPCQWAFDVLRKCQEAPENRNATNANQY